MNFSDKKLQKELDLVKKSLESERGEIEILNYLKPLVFSVGNDFIDLFEKENNLIIKDRNVVIEKGWTHLHFAIKKYLEKIDVMVKGELEVFTFSEYFTWFIKQGILEYLQSENKD
jgi:hypothetical protein